MPRYRPGCELPRSVPVTKESATPEPDESGTDVTAHS